MNFGTEILNELLSREPLCALAGQILQVITVYVSSEHGDTRRLSVVYAFDALGADLPHTIEHTIPLVDEEPVEAYRDEAAPRPEMLAGDDKLELPEVPMRGLLQVVLNAILYAFV